MRYPKLIRDPGRKAEQMVLNIDLAPTLLDMAGVSIPEHFQGKSLLPLLTAAKSPGRESWLYEHFPVFPIPIPGITAVRTRRYKYIKYQNDLRPRELFDLKMDPREKTNIIDLPEGRKILENIETEMERLKKSTGYRFFTHG